MTTTTRPQPLARRQRPALRDLIEADRRPHRLRALTLARPPAVTRPLPPRG